jgi:hypothetical protein
MYVKNLCLHVLPPHFELIVGCKNSPQTGGAIYVGTDATCNIDGGTFLSNTARSVSQQRKKPLLTTPFTRKFSTGTGRSYLQPGGSYHWPLCCIPRQHGEGCAAHKNHMYHTLSCSHLCLDSVSHKISTMMAIMAEKLNSMHAMA